jgi:hypothetical protein
VDRSNLIEGETVDPAASPARPDDPTVISGEILDR